MRKRSPIPIREPQPIILFPLVKVWDPSTPTDLRPLVRFRCTNCNKRSEIGDRFCGGCGKRLVE